MADPLLTRDARALRTLARPRWLHRVLPCTMLLTATVVAGLHNDTAPVPPCTDAAPCGPDAGAAVVFGLLLAAAVTGFVHARTAAWLAAAFAVTGLGYDLFHPAVASPAWVYAADVALVALCFAVAGVGRARPATGTALAWLTAVAHRQPPAPVAPPRPQRRWRVAAATAGLVAVGLTAWTWVGQSRADDRQRAATRVTGEVTAAVDEFTVRVRLPDGTLVDTDVRDAGEHPVGQAFALYTDSDGLHQPVSEPYDLTGLLVLAVVAAGTGLAGRARGTARTAALRSLFGRPQPVTRVYVRAVPDRVAVYACDARPGEPAVAELRCAPGTPALLDAVPVDDGVDQQPFLPPTRPALLYGVPTPGRWCTVVVDGEPAVPVGPLRAGLDAPAFTEPATTAWTVPPLGVLPLRSEEVEALSPADRDANPYQVRTHAQHRAIGYALTAGMPLVLVGPAGLLPAVGYRTALAVAAVAVGLACWVGWRLYLRPRLAWNAGGVAVAGVFGGGRFPWWQVMRIEPGRGEVTIGTGHRHLVVAARGGTGVLAGVLPGRDAEQLANALRYARERAIAEVDPPRLAAPVPPVGLYVLWLVATPLIAWALQAFSGW
ncbi:hypothetical protein ACNTMW_23450 [Planosporangium sp. 12N6]|uniref:hypothetical protein n=1 Tax=Planosporangium spinosum TaxID=3402278 RepID=UPI003CF0E1E7